MYNINHTNVDGYGNVGQESTLAGAVIAACWLQACALANGNPWHYTYSVSLGNYRSYVPRRDTLPLGLLSSEWLAWRVDHGIITEAEYNAEWRKLTAAVCPIYNP